MTSGEIRESFTEEVTFEFSLTRWIGFPSAEWLSQIWVQAPALHKTILWPVTSSSLSGLTWYMGAVMTMMEEVVVEVMRANTCAA